MQQQLTRKSEVHPITSTKSFTHKSIYAQCVLLNSLWHFLNEQTICSVFLFCNRWKDATPILKPACQYTWLTTDVLFKALQSTRMPAVQSCLSKALKHIILLLWVLLTHLTFVSELPVSYSINLIPLRIGSGSGLACMSPGYTFVSFIPSSPYCTSLLPVNKD